MKTDFNLKGEFKMLIETGIPYLKNRGDGVDGHYCIARKHEEGYHEFWNNDSKVWCSAGTVFALGAENKANVKEAEK